MGSNTVTLELVAILLVGICLLFVLAVVRRVICKKAVQPFDFRNFSPHELERLKSMNLLSEDEARKIQSIITARAMETMKVTDSVKEKPDLQSLLSEAEKLKKEHLAKQKTDQDKSVE